MFPPDSLFRSTDLAERKKYVQLVEDVKGYGGTVHIFSSLHTSGEKVSYDGYIFECRI